MWQSHFFTPVCHVIFYVSWPLPYRDIDLLWQYTLCDATLNEREEKERGERGGRLWAKERNWLGFFFYVTSRLVTGGGVLCDITLCDWNVIWWSRYVTDHVMWCFTSHDTSHYLTIMLCDAHIMWHHVWCNHVMELSRYVTITLCNLTLCM
jgi:hypothetical protein